MGSRIHDLGHMSLGRSDPEMTDLWGGGTTVQLSPERGDARTRDRKVFGVRVVFVGSSCRF
jgi:hypothetical protein